MRTTCLAALLLAAASLLIRCGGHDQSAAASSTAAAPATGTSNLAGGDAVGVPECDSYLKKYMECVTSKVPEAARAQYQAAFDQTRQAWRQAAATPEGKAGLAMGCKQAQAASEQAMKVYGCSF